MIRQLVSLRMGPFTQRPEQDFHISDHSPELSDSLLVLVHQSLKLVKILFRLILRHFVQVRIIPASRLSGQTRNAF